MKQYRASKKSAEQEAKSNVLFQKISLPPTEDFLICTPSPYDFPFQGVFHAPPYLRTVENG